MLANRGAGYARCGDGFVRESRSWCRAGLEGDDINKNEDQDEEEDEDEEDGRGHILRHGQMPRAMLSPVMLA